jgi:hypothetical protein
MMYAVDDTTLPHKRLELVGATTRFRVDRLPVDGPRASVTGNLAISQRLQN